MYIPDHELVISFARSGGKGGQNVNKVSTKVVVHWHIGKSRALAEEQKMRVRAKLAHKITNNDELVVVAEAERSQLQNREEATKRLRALIASALRVPKKRTPTKPTWGSKQRRLESKKRQSHKKSNRQLRGEW